MKKLLEVCFIGGIIGFLVLGFVTTVFFPEEMNYLENRYANKIEAFTIESFMDGGFQTQMSSAFNDQVPASGYMKKIYNSLNARFEKSIVFKVKEIDENRYYSMKGGQMFQNHIVYGTSELEESKERLERKITNIKSNREENKNTEFYVYYIEKDTDINFETNEKVGIYEYLKERFDEEGIPYNGFRVENFSEFSDCFYKTDHHWNNVGSYKAYKDVARFLDPGVELIEPIGERLLMYEFSGSKAAGIGVTGIITEPFPVYEFAYPQMSILIDRETAEDYGKQKLYLNEKQSSISYGSFYGWDNGQIVFDTNQKDKENLLIIGESYDNAILKLLAAGFNKTHSIDLRYYENTFGESFNITEYIAENDINKVLYIGNMDYFRMEDFLVED